LISIGPFHKKFYDFQRLAFVLRDFKLTDELIYGIEGGNRLLDKVLRLPDGTDKRGQLSKMNEVRKNIRQYFEQGVSCCESFPK
jgi:hypothetical protein